MFSSGRGVGSTYGVMDFQFCNRAGLPMACEAIARYIDEVHPDAVVDEKSYL